MNRDILMKGRVEVVDTDELVSKPVVAPKWGERACLACGKTESLKRCGTCKLAYFCNQECQRAAFKTHRDACNAAREKEKVKKKESASVDELWATHESRMGMGKDKAMPALEKPSAAQSSLHPRFDPKEHELVKQRKKGELLGVLLRGGDEYDVSPVMLSVEELKEYRARSEAAHLVQAASKESVPLLAVIVPGTTRRVNLAAERIMTRPDIGFPDGKYQLGVGDVIVFRSDAKDLTCGDVTFCFDFCGFVISDYYRKMERLDAEKLHELWKSDVKFKKHNFE
jgi:hypothetical protein